MCQTRALLFPVPQAGKMSTSKLIHYCSSHPAGIGFLASMPANNNNIILNHVNLSDFQTLIGIAAYVTLDTEQLISHTRTAFLDTVALLQISDCGMIAASEVHKLLTKIHDILYSAVSTCFCNTSHILTYLFHSASRQHHEVWASQFPILYNIKDSVPPSEVACMVASTGCWHMLTKNHHMDCPSLQPL